VQKGKYNFGFQETILQTYSSQKVARSNLFVEENQLSIGYQRMIEPRTEHDSGVI
jgi:hypothetical protein